MHYAEAFALERFVEETDPGEEGAHKVHGVFSPRPVPLAASSGVGPLRR
jgi:hypothetical protein